MLQLENFGIIVHAYEKLRVRKLKKDEENEEKNDADEFRQQCFESLKKYVEEKIISEGQFLRMITIANYYRQLQESIKLLVKGCTP